MHVKKSRLSGWGRYPQEDNLTLRPEQYNHFTIQPTTIARGQGRSYGDAALNKTGYVVLTERFNRLLAFDKSNGIIKAEAGIILGELLQLIIPYGWFLPVLPGTQFVSLGGCVAADVHGKNHHYAGSFGQHVIALELIKADNQTIECSAEQNPFWFWTTVGGMGLTGIIGTVTLKLLPIETSYLTCNHYPTNDLEQSFADLEKSELSKHYSVAWLDLLCKKNTGRGIIMTAQHMQLTDLPLALREKPLKIFNQQPLNIPLLGHFNLLHKFLMNSFNAFYYKRQAKKHNPVIMNYADYFFPLDRIKNWNYLYGRQGFMQFQCVFSTQYAYPAIKTLLKTIQKNNIPAYLGVLKRFGAGNPGFLSFPIAGYTLALDIPLAKSQTLTLSNLLISIVKQYLGKIYLAKDVLLNPEDFRQMYTQYQTWLRYKNELDPYHFFTSSLSRRLAIGVP